MKMKFSTIAFAATAISCASAHPLLLPKGAVLGNLDTVSQLPPQVVVGYLAQCANVSDAMVPEDSECLFDNFVALQFPGNEFRDLCSPPAVSESQVLANFQAANALCMDDFTDYLGSATSFVLQVFAAESCWTSLCNDEQALVRVESQYMEQCANVDLPYPSISSGELIITKDEENDAILTCMLVHVMSTPANDFGFDEPPVVCWPPAYDNIGAVCLESLAKPAYDKCTDNKAFFDALNEDIALDEEVQQYMSMSMSMDYDDGDDSEDDEFTSDDDMSEMMLIARFCDIMESITTDRGLECLGIICDNEIAVADPSVAPSLELSAMPTEAASSMPSIAPTQKSSAMPSEAPSSMPSASPSVAPSVSPSAIPSVAPSSSPSSSPTFHDVQQIVEVELVAEFAIDMASSNVPDLLDEAVETSILGALSSFSGVDANVLTVGGNNVRRRRLQNVVPVQFRVDATKSCYFSDCNALATSLIADLNAALLGSVADGSMATLIRQEATTQTVGELATANVIANSYQLISSDSQLNDPVVITEPEVVQSSASLVSSTVAGLVALLLASFVAF
jgi:hypothetical protein